MIRAIGLFVAFVVFATALPLRTSATPTSADSLVSRIRARGAVRCAGIVRPGLAVPTVDGKRWYGVAPDVCRALAAAMFGDAEKFTFRPYLDDGSPARTGDDADDVVFLSGAQLVGAYAVQALPLSLGPAIVHDGIGLLVPASGAKRVADLATKTVCVEPGSAGDRALEAYFAAHALSLHEHPFQETDEMRQAYGDGECDALAGPISTLASVRADPREGRRADRILPETLADDPIFAATSGDAEWSRIVWWTFSVLVDDEASHNDAHSNDDSVEVLGVPPAVGAALRLAPSWMHDVLAAVGNYGSIFARNYGSDSPFKLTRGKNALWTDGGSIFGLYVQ